MNLRCNQWNDENIEGLSKSVKHIKLPSVLAYDEMNNKIMEWTMKWWTEQINDEMNNEMM